MLLSLTATPSHTSKISQRPYLELPSFSKLDLVLFGVGANDENSIDIGIAKVQKDQFDEVLECLGHIPQLKWHSRELEQTKQSCDSGLWATAGSTGI